MAATDSTHRRTAADRRIDRMVGALFAGIPQEGVDLGRSTAPITLEVFIDLEDPTSRWWFREDLPEIIHAYVRTGVLQLRYHAFKRNTYWPAVFVEQQTAALAAGAQGRLWNFVDTFFYEQGEELTHYVTESFLEGIARQTPGLNLALWRTERRTGRREERTTLEDQTARALGLHVTPAFRIGKSGGNLSILTARTTIQYEGQHHPIALVEGSDIAIAIKQLRRRGRLRHTPQTKPKRLISVLR
jgi:hypothetical protein